MRREWKRSLPISTVAVTVSVRTTLRRRNPFAEILLDPGSLTDRGYRVEVLCRMLNPKSNMQTEMESMPVIEDSLVNRKLYCHLLAEAGYGVRTVTRADEALEIP